MRSTIRTAQIQSKASRSRTAGGIGVWFFLALTAVSHASGIELAETIWGFDGKVVPGRFNLLSLRFVNDGQRPFDGAVVLFLGDGVGRRVGPEIVEPCFLAPRSNRWVQFHPYIGGTDDWLVEWGQPGLPVRLKAPELGAPAVCLLDATDNPVPGSTPMRVFPEELFPPSSAAAGGLQALLLDHVPRWEAQRARALLDWVRAGGTLHVLQDASGRFPVFGGELSPFNTDSERLPLGAGLAVRHPITRREATGSYLRGRGFEPKLLVTGEGDSVVAMGLEETLFPLLKTAHHVRLPWSLIYLLAVGYLLLVGPGCYLLARRASGFRTPLLVLVLLIVTFSAAFAVVGRRGYGEESMVRGITYARRLDRGRYDVTRWAEAFVTKGRRYVVSYPTLFSLYATSHDFEAVAGAVRNGRDGNFTVDIPLFTARDFLFRGIMDADDVDVAIEQWQPLGEGGEMVFRVNGKRPDGWFGAALLYDGKVYQASGINDGVIRVSGEGESLEAFDKAGRATRNRVGDPHAPPRDVLRGALPILISWEAADGAALFGYRLSAPEAGPDRAVLFLLADQPGPFRLLSKGMGNDTGFVVYHVDVSRKDAPHG